MSESSERRIARALGRHAVNFPSGDARWRPCGADSFGALSLGPCASIAQVLLLVRRSTRADAVIEFALQSVRRANRARAPIGPALQSAGAPIALSLLSIGFVADSRKDFERLKI